MNQHDDVMAKNFTKRFVQHGGIGLAAQSVSKLALNHAESGLNVRAQMVVLQELLSPVIEIVEHLPIVTASRCAHTGVRFESDEGRSPDFVHRLSVLVAGISRICAHFSHLEIL